MLQLYVDAPLALTVVLLPLQIGLVVTEAETEGTAFTVIETVAVFVQPLVVPVTVYIVVDDGETE
ncbi:hypothetical protein SDC9_151377 [bioreactor metagenome]|uniref:Uncharacterized protein n=1 Tax=bioreactor metagenome TaxID=1076179 RepID=A0A645EQ42_9ZZZZ